MITFFTTPKAFQGHIGIIQRNAIQSWQRLHSGVEILLMGPEKGTAETACEFGLRYEPGVSCNEFGTVLLSSLFEKALETARNEIRCFINCDIILTPDFVRALRALLPRHDHFLMVGRRWDLPVTEPVNFTVPAWSEDLRNAALRNARQRPPQWIDYFAFRGNFLKGKIPSFAVGRPGYDNWLIWRTRSLGIPVVDASRDVVAIHQNHDYAHHPGGEKGVWEGAEARRNAKLLGGWSHFYTVDDATHRLASGILRRSRRHGLLLVRRALRNCHSSIWFGLLDFTRSARHRLGLRKNPPASAGSGKMAEKNGVKAA
jgi:hypothetical protein